MTHLRIETTNSHWEKQKDAWASGFKEALAALPSQEIKILKVNAHYLIFLAALSLSCPQIQLLLKSPFETSFFFLGPHAPSVKHQSTFLCVHVVVLSKRFSSQKAGRPDRLYGTSYPHEHTLKKRGEMNQIFLAHFFLLQCCSWPSQLIWRPIIWQFSSEEEDIDSLFKKVGKVYTTSITSPFEHAPVLK